MNIQEIIIQKLERLVEENPQLQFTYELDTSDNTHCIEVLPKIFNQNETYRQFKVDFVFRLSQEFPSDFLFFSTDERMYKIEKPSHTITGKAFVEENKHENLLVLDL